MGFFDLFKQSNINQGIEEYKRTDDAVLLDVRTPREYQEGHIPESKNVPLQQLDNIASVAKNKDIPLFVYCYSGSRSRQAPGILQRMGYSKVNDATQHIPLSQAKAGDLVFFHSTYNAETYVTHTSVSMQETTECVTLATLSDMQI